MGLETSPSEEGWSRHNLSPSRGLPGFQIKGRWEGRASRIVVTAQDKMKIQKLLRMTKTQHVDGAGVNMELENLDN